jgi:C-terminal processing protease CtpA/Prc
MEEIASYVKAISDSSYQHLIIDVRNNYGGNEQNVIKLFGLIAQQPFSLVVSRKINNKDSYQFFDNCLNYGPESGEIFSNYFSIEGKDGFYSVNDSSSIILNPINNFKGKVYVLTNERSFSASTIFPALVHKHKRGIVVGRETGSTYYHMNAEKFADLRLPNSCIVIQIPLVQIVFDTIPDPSIPWGRGVMPDYSVNFTLSELAWENGDSILNYTRELIKKEKYLPEEKVTLNKEHINETVTTNNHNYLYVLIGIFVLGLILYYFNKNR